MTESIRLLLFVVGCLSLVLLGLYSRSDSVMGENQCKMTYTSLDKKLLRVESKIVGPQLYKYTNALTKKLNKQPVLFVPGHQGR